MLQAQAGAVTTQIFIQNRYKEVTGGIIQPSFLPSHNVRAKNVTNCWTDHNWGVDTEGGSRLQRLIKLLTCSTGQSDSCISVSGQSEENSLFVKVQRTFTNKWIKKGKFDNREMTKGRGQIKQKALVIWHKIPKMLISVPVVFDF